MGSRQSDAFVERYQILYEKDPNSKVFAPLAEAYRKRGMLDAAEGICLKGVQMHPHFAGGHMALARIFLDQNKTAKAIEELKAVVELSPENLLAYRLLFDCYIKVGDKRNALSALKMVLFLNPEDEKAQIQVQSLESLTATDYGEDIFEMKGLSLAGDEIGAEIIEPLKDAPKEAKNLDVARKQRFLERALSLADAFIVRNDFDKAVATLQEAENLMGVQPEISKRMEQLSDRSKSFGTKITSDRHSPPSKVIFLEKLLDRIEARRRV